MIRIPPPSYIETPATERNNHANSLENDEEEALREVDEMKSVRSQHAETSPRTIHSVEASDEEERRGGDLEPETELQKEVIEEPDTISKSSG